MSFRFDCPLPSKSAAEEAERRQQQLTKPSRSLGRLEDIAIQMAAWQDQPLPKARPAASVIFAADHPVTRHSISPYPAAVTQAMVQNFIARGAACSVLAEALQLPLSIVDVGIDGPEPVASPSGTAKRLSSPHEPSAVSYVHDVAAQGIAGDLRVTDAMDRDLFEHCLTAGRRAVDRLPSETKVFIPGDMGIGNTTVAAALSAAIIGGDPNDFVGAGTGAPREMIERKASVVKDALVRLAGKETPFELLRKLGGREVAAIAGAIMAALERRMLVLIDGFVVTSAALAVCAAQPAAKSGLLFAHCSEERAHRRVLAHLDQKPLLDLGMRLGEASGALIAFSLVEQACALHARMATFESAGVPNRE